MVTHTRNYGIDLLRLVFMFMICVIHVIGQGGVLSSSAEGTAHYSVYWLIEVLVFCAADGFAFISGYTARNKPQKYSKIVNMWFQVLFYSFFLSVLVTLIGLDGSWTMKTIVVRLLPVTFNEFWYFTAYFALFFVAPILNEFLFKANESESKKMFIVLFVLFSIMGTLADPFKSQWGYSAIWLIVIYCLGVLAKRIKLFEQKKTITLVIMWLCLNLVSWALLIFSGIGVLVNYLSPTILLSSMILVVAFSRLSLNGRVIRKLSPLAFGVYLFQTNPVIWKEVLKDAFVFIANKSLIVSIIYILAYACLIFITGLVVEFIRSSFAHLFKIDRLSQKIVKSVAQKVKKIVVLLQ